MKLIAGKVAWNYDNVYKKINHTQIKKMKNQKKKIVPKKLNKETKIAVESCNENSNLNKKNLSK